MDEMSDKLMTILQMVNDWLKFSEAKNAILLGFSGAGITTTAAFLSAAPSVPQSVQLGILITTFLLCVCSFICSLSFLPRTNLEMIVWRRSKPGKASKGVLSDSDNLYFFGHLYLFPDFIVVFHTNLYHCEPDYYSLYLIRCVVKV